MNNRFKLQMFAPLFLLLSCGSQGQNRLIGNNNLQQKDRQVPAFHGVDNSGSIDVVLVPASGQKVTVIAESNIQQYVKTEVKNGVLQVYLKAPGIHSWKIHKLEVVVATNNLKTLSSNGSGDIKSRGTLRSSSLEIEDNGSGDLDLHLNAEGLKLNKNSSGDVTIEGSFKTVEIRDGSSGDIELSGSADKMVVTHGGSGDLEARHFKVGDLTITNSGSGDAEIWAEGTLSIMNSGSGDVDYGGTPNVTRSVKSGSGDIERD